MELICLTFSPEWEYARGTSRGVGIVMGVSLLISIDPGLSTGVAIFNDGELVRSYTTSAPYDTLRIELASLEEADRVVCEKGPTNHRRQAAACEPVEAIVSGAHVDVAWVRPSSWKNTPNAVLLDSDDPRNIHERDAIRMGRWHLAGTRS